MPARADNTLVQRPLSLGVTGLLGLVAAAAAWFTVVGSDALWLSALGDDIRSTHTIPVGIPFAAAPSGDWVNTTVLGQLVFSLIHEAGSLGVVAAQVLVVATVMTTLAAEALGSGARSSTTSVVIVAVAIGAVAPLLIARAQLLSLLPYAVLLVLIRRDHERASPTIWWAVPLVAVWSNVHGAVLAGVAVFGCYLVFSRVRRSPLATVVLGFATLAATCLNPGLLRAPSYYAGVFGGEATSDDSGMWSRLTLSNPFDVLLVVAAVLLLAMAFRRRQPLWEYVAALGLAVAAVTAARHGIWLLLFLAVPAAAGSPERDSTMIRPRLAAPGRATAVAAAVSVAVAATLLVIRAPALRASDADASQLAAAAQGRVVLVAEPLAESLAAAGAKVWASNPLDAFTKPDQAAYLAFIKGDSAGASRALASTDMVIAPPGSAQARLALAAGMSHVTTVASYDLFTR